MHQKVAAQLCVRAPSTCVQERDAPVLAKRAAIEPRMACICMFLKFGMSRKMRLMCCSLGSHTDRNTVTAVRAGMLQVSAQQANKHTRTLHNRKAREELHSCTCQTRAALPVRPATLAYI